MKDEPMKPRVPETAFAPREAEQPLPSALPANDKGFLVIWSGSGAGPETAPAAPRTPDAAARAAQWGLASLLFSGVLAVLIPLLTIMMLMIPIFAQVVSTWDRTGRLVATICVPLAVLGFDTMAVLAVLLAGLGERSARKQKLPAMLHLTGLILGFITLFWGLLATVAMFPILGGLW
jgi:hypothetical protein